MTIADKIEYYNSIVQKTGVLSELYGANIELEKIKGDLFKMLGPNIDDVDIKSKIGMVSKLQEICDSRQKDLQEKFKVDSTKDQQYNYNFVKNAAYIVDERTYNEIAESASMTRADFKRKIINQRGAFEKK